jgi:hypothetical protein
MKQQNSPEPMARPITSTTEPDGKEYQVCAGFWFHKETAPEIIEWILTAYERKSRMRFHWGDPKTGLDWGDIHDVTGNIGRSMGPIRVPLLLHNNKSFGGGAILDHRIVKIAYANKQYCKSPVYIHPTYHTKEGP